MQAGIKEVVTLQPPEDFSDRWGAHLEKSEELFSECGIKLRLLPNQLVLSGCSSDTVDYYRKILGE